MHITTLSVTNCRGITGTWELGQCVMIIGDNFAGKSGLLNAIKLLVFGYLPHPRKDKQVPPIELASGDFIATSGNLSDGRTVARRWERNRSGVKASHVPSEEPIAELILLDPKLYFDQSPNKRMAFVFNSVPLPDTLSPDALLAELKNVKLEENNELSEQCLKALLEVVRGKLSASFTFQAQIEMILEKLKEDQLVVKQTVDRMQKTAAGIEELQAKKPEDFDNELSEIDIELRGANAKLGIGQTALGTIEADIRVAAERKARRDALQEKINGEQNARDSITKAEKQIAEYDTILAAALPDYTTQLTALEADGKDLAQKSTTINLAKANAESAVRNLTQRIEDIDSQINARQQEIIRLERERDADLALTVCPTCQAEGTAWRNRVTKRCADAVERVNADIAGLNSQRGKLCSEKIEQTNLFNDKAAELTAAEKALADKRAEYQKVKQERDDAVKERTKVENNRRGGVSALEYLQKLLPEIEAAKTELASIPATDTTVLVQQSEEIAKSIRGINEQINTLNQKRNQAISSKAAIVQQMQAIEERKKAETNLAVHKAALKVIQDFQRKMVDGAFGGMMATANRFTTGLLASPLEYRDGEVGRMRDGRWVPNDQFSDSEQIITYAAMSTALGAKSAFKLVVVDELTRVRGERKAMIISRMLELIGNGIIDQFIGVDTCTDDGIVPSYYHRFYRDDKLSLIHLK